MALIWADGFENAGLWTRKYILGTGAGGYTPAVGRNGSGNCMAIDTVGTGGASVKRIVKTSDKGGTFIVGAAFRWTSTSIGTTPDSNDYLIQHRSDLGATSHMGITPTAGSGADLMVKRGTTTLGTTSGLNLIPGSWYYIEFKSTLNDTTGSYTLRVNNSVVLTATGVDTKNAGTDTVYDSFAVSGTSGVTSDVQIDDLYVCNGGGGINNDFLGDIRVETLHPDATGFISQWIGSDGDSINNWNLVNDIGYTPTNFVQSATIGNQDLYDFQPLVRTTGAVKGVCVTGVLSKSDTGARSARFIVRTGGATQVGATEVLTTTDAVYKHVWDQNPTTAVPWTVGNMTAVQYGVECQ